MKEYIVEVTWEVSKTVKVCAKNKDRAIKLIKDEMPYIANGCDYNSNYNDGTETILMEYADISDVDDDEEYINII